MLYTSQYKYKKQSTDILLKITKFYVFMHLLCYISHRAHGRYISMDADLQG